MGTIFVVKVKVLVTQSCPTVSSWTVAHQASLSMEFSRQEDWSGLPGSSGGDLPDPGVKPVSPAWQMDSLPSEPPGKPMLVIRDSISFWQQFHEALSVLTYSISTAIL